MATETDQTQDLKYLGFIKIAVVSALTLLSNLYEFTKESAGPHLRSGVSMVEGGVKRAVVPVYERFSGVPVAVLFFFDNKVDETAGKLAKYMPLFLKHALCQAQSFMSEVQSKGFLATGKDTYTKYEPVAEDYTVKAWWAINKLPLVPQVATVMVPTASHWSEKYNHIVRSMAQKGYTVFVYLPLVPVDRIVKAFKRGQVAKEGAVNGDNCSFEGSS